MEKKNTTASPGQEKSMRYLLGRLSAEEIAEFEAQCFDNDDKDELFDEMVELESDLTHSYIRGELTPAERQEFETGYLISPARRRNLEFARLLENRISEAGKTASVRPQSNAPRMQRLPPLHRPGPTWTAFSALAAVAVVALGVGSWIAVANYRLKGELGRLHVRQSEFQRMQQELQGQLAALTEQLQENAAGVHGKPNPHLQPAGPDMLAFNLPPGLPRSAGPLKQLILPAGILLVELRLYLEDDDYAVYRASLETSEGRRVWRKIGLKSRRDSRRRSFLSLAIPPDILSSGDYVIKLTGTKAGVASEDILVYRFSVAGR